MQTLKIESKGKTLHVSLNRPDVRNAFHPSMIQDLTQVFAEIAQGKRPCAAVVLKGEGASFCSGADLSWMKSMVDYSRDENLADSEKLFDMFAAIRSCPVPVIGRLHGHVMGGAVGLAAVCDVAAAESATVFCFSEVKLGLAPAVISPFVLEKMPASQAYRFMLTAETFSARQAEQAGLVHFTGDLAAVDEFVEKTAKSLADNGPEAVRATKALLRTVHGTRDWGGLKAVTTQAIAERRTSAEGQEGLRGFLEKRAPSWKSGK